MNEITITIKEHEQMVRTAIAAKMAFALLKKSEESGYLRTDELHMLLDEFGADFE